MSSYRRIREIDSRGRKMRIEPRKERLRFAEKEDGVNPTSEIPLEPLEVEKFELPVKENDAIFYETEQDKFRFMVDEMRRRLAESDRMMEEFLDKAVKKGIVTKEEVERGMKGEFFVLKDKRERTPQKKEGGSPAKRQTPGSGADGEYQPMDAIIGNFIGKLYAQSSVLSSLSVHDAADAIEELLTRDDPATKALIGTYIDAAIEDVAFEAKMASISLSPAQPDNLQMPIACFVPGCVNKIKHRCAGCKAAYYCSPQCQTEHWESGHAAVCNSNN